MRYRIHKRLNTRRRKYAFFMLLFLGVFLAILASSMLYDKYKISHGGVPAANEISTSDEGISEEPVPDSYSVPASQPLSINIPSVSIKAFIQRVSTDKQNRVAVPGNINMAGWYIGSAKPGDKGLSIIDGHYSGRYGKAAFADLAKLKKGDEFSVEYGDHRVVKFEVKSIRTMPLSEVASALFARDNSIEKQMNLITCGGKFLSSEKTYDSRVLVIASAI